MFLAKHRVVDFDLSQFNEQQRAVVEHGEGPLLVIAGAGTGKTHVLTGRILFLISKGVCADSILALTFAEKAAREMAARIDIALPLGASSPVIATFHSFCERILRESGLEIGLATDFRIFAEPDLLILLKKEIDRFEFEYFSPRGAPDRLLKELISYFGRLQEEGQDPGSYATRAAALRADSDQEKEEKMRQLELSRAYRAYIEILQHRSILDYAGLLQKTALLLSTRVAVRAFCQEKYRYVLVDEFQDTNEVQQQILEMICEKHENIVVVGDDDQAIYKWRGASVENMRRFRKRFHHAASIALTQNYRSGQAILDFAHRLIQNNNPRRLEVEEKIDKKLISRPSVASVAPVLKAFGHMDEEIDFIVNEALESIRANSSAAILTRTNALAAPYITELQKRGVEFALASRTQLTTMRGVKDLIGLLRFLADPSDDIALFRLLSASFLDIPMETLLSMMSRARTQNQTFFSGLARGQTKEIAALLAKLIEASRTAGIPELVGSFLTESGYLERARESDDGSRIEEIARFSRVVKDFSARHESASIRQFLEYMEVAESEMDEAPATEHLLSVLTIHGAKGLEFDSVFIPGLVAGKFPQNARREPFSMPSDAACAGELFREEERRLLYVAMTRAKSRLFMTYSVRYEGPKLWKPSAFFAEIDEAASTVRAPTKRTQSPLPLPDSRAHRPITLEIKKVSYSQIDCFRTCPLKYQFRYLFQLPSRPSGALSVGSSVHNTLRDYHNERKKPAGLFPHEDSRNLLERLFEKNWIQAGFDSRAARDREKRHAWRMLERYSLQHADDSPAFVEKPFTVSLGEGITINGRIDRIDKRPDGTYEIIDYKTGEKPEKNLAKDLQLSIYALAASTSLQLSVSSLSLYYLDAGEKISTTRSEKQLAECAKELKSVIEEMRSSDFAASPGFHCGYCDYRLVCPSAKVGI